MPLTVEELLPYRGAYVKGHGEHPWMWMRDSGFSDFKEQSFEGLLGMRIVQLTQGVVRLPFRNEFNETFRVFHIEELWRPAKNAVRYVCNVCARETRVGEAIFGTSFDFGITSKKCSLCNKVPREHREIQGVQETSIDLWKFEDQEELLEYLRDEEFRAILKSHNQKFFIHGADIGQPTVKGQGRVWNLRFKSETGGYLQAVSDEPPTIIDWESWFDLKQLQERFREGYSHDGLIRWGHDLKQSL